MVHQRVSFCSIVFTSHFDSEELRATEIIVIMLRKDVHVYGKTC